MSGWRNLYYKLLNIPIKTLVRSKCIPTDPVADLGLDTTRPILYVLPYNSKADLLTLRASVWHKNYPILLSRLR